MRRQHDGTAGAVDWPAVPALADCRKGRGFVATRGLYVILNLDGPPTHTSRRTAMAEKLKQGDRFPTIELNLTDGSTLTLPEQIPSRYLALLFYRGEW